MTNQLYLPDYREIAFEENEDGSSMTVRICNKIVQVFDDIIKSAVSKCAVNNPPESDIKEEVLAEISRSLTEKFKNTRGFRENSVLTATVIDDKWHIKFVPVAKQEEPEPPAETPVEAPVETPVEPEPVTEPEPPAEETQPKEEEQPEATAEPSVEELHNRELAGQMAAATVGAELLHEQGRHEEAKMIEERTKELEESMNSDKTEAEPVTVDPNYINLDDPAVRLQILQSMFPQVIDPSMVHLQNFLEQHHRKEGTKSFLATDGTFPTETTIVYDNITIAIVKMMDGAFWRILAARTDPGLQDHTWIATKHTEGRWVRICRDIQRVQPGFRNNGRGRYR